MLVISDLSGIISFFIKYVGVFSGEEKMDFNSLNGGMERSFRGESRSYTPFGMVRQLKKRLYKETIVF